MRSHFTITHFIFNGNRVCIDVGYCADFVECREGGFLWAVFFILNRCSPGNCDRWRVYRTRLSYHISNGAKFWFFIVSSFYIRGVEYSWNAGLMAFISCMKFGLFVHFWFYVLHFWKWINGVIEKFVCGLRTVGELYNSSRVT
jgi:hypothetical protein